MYPRVKVREQDKDDQHAVHSSKRSSVQSLKDFQSLSIRDSCFPVKEYQDVSQPVVARVPKSYVPNVVMPPISVSEEAEKDCNKIDEKDRPNIRASSIPRPRAVLSSPDNDAVIGNKNKLKVVRPSALKNHNLTQNRHAQCKVIPNQIMTESPIPGRKSKDAADAKGDHSVKKGSAMAVSSQRRYPGTGKPNSVRL